MLFMRPVLAFVLGLSLSCASAPPNLSPVGSSAFYRTRVVQSLDVIRDLAISANGQVPPVVSKATTTKFVLYHRSALVTIAAAGTGWKAAVVAGLDETQKDLPASEASLFKPYVALAKIVLNEVSN